MESWRQRSLLCLASSLLLYVCFYPIAFGQAAWVALVPAFVASHGLRRRTTFFAGWLTGIGFFLPVLQWVRVAHPMMYMSWFALAITCATFTAIVFLGIRLLIVRKVPYAVALPVVWVGGEYIRCHFPTGFPFLESVGLYMPVGFGWYQLGYSQRDAFNVLQFAEFAGVYGISTAIAAVNGAAIDLCLAYCGRSYVRPWYGLPIALGLAAVVLTTPKWNRDLFPAEFPEREPISVALVQTNLPQYQKNARAETMSQQFANLGDEAMKARPELIVWPETSMPSDWYDDELPHNSKNLPETTRGHQDKFQTFFANRYPTNTLFGLNGLIRQQDGVEYKSNSALLLDPQGNYVNRYDKIHLVPFGEYVPLASIAPWMKTFTPYTHDYSCRPGTEWRTFRMIRTDKATTRFSCLICYESSDPAIARQMINRNELTPEFFVNMSNDGWFDGTSEHEEHLSICRFRAVETRRPILRSVNMGISALIDPFGEIKAIPAGNLVDSKKISAVLHVELKPIAGDYRTLYSRFGDVLPAAFLFVFLLLLICRKNGIA
jgi:apolipoprotein N-acyltransferase